MNLLNQIQKLILLFILAITFGCLGNGQKLVTVAEGEAYALDPARSYSDGALLVVSQVYEPLISYHYLLRPFRMESLLAAKSPDIKKNGKVFNFKIKEGVFYHPVKDVIENRTVKAEDFVVQILRLVDPKNNSPIANMLSDKILGLSDAIESLKGSKNLSLDLLGKKIEGLRIIGDYEFEVELKRADNFFIYWFSTYFFVPIPREVVEKNVDLEKNFVGTGPYRLSVEKNKYVFNRFGKYRRDIFPTLGDRESNVRGYLKDAEKPIPFLSKFEILVEQDFDKKFKMFLDGDVDWMDVTNTEYGRVAKHPEVVKLLNENEIVLTNFPSLALRWLGFNMQDPIFKDEKGKKLRLAIAHGIDREKYIDALANGTNMEANSIINPGIWGYDPSSKPPFFFSIDKAKELLKDFEKPIKLKYSTRTDNEIGLKEANFLKKELAKIGIDLEIEVLTFRKFLKLGRQGKLQFWTDYWIYDYPDPQNILQLLYSKNFPGINKSGYQNDEIDELYQKLLSDPSNIRKMRYIRSIENRFYEDLPWVLISYDRSYYIARKHVKNLKKSSFIRNYFKYLKLNR